MMDDEFHVLMSRMGLRNYTIAAPISGSGPCVITLMDTLGPLELSAIAGYFRRHEVEVVVLQKEGI